MPWLGVAISRGKSLYLYSGSLRDPRRALNAPHSNTRSAQARIPHSASDPQTACSVNNWSDRQIEGQRQWGNAVSTLSGSGNFATGRGSSIGLAGVLLSSPQKFIFL